MIKTPEKIHVNTGESEVAYQTIDEFFISIKEEIQERIPSYEHNFEIRVENACKEGDIPTDDVIHMLRYRDKVVAVVTETRTEFNRVQFDFFQNLEGIVS